MELELSLGVSPAQAKGTVKHMLTYTRAGDGEGHELVLELGLRTAKGDELNNLKTSMQPEDMQEEDLYKGCPLPTAPSETGSVNSYLQVEVPVLQAAKDNGGFGGRTKKKLRLSKEQYGFLEDSFKEHSTLTPRQNSDLASRLNLEPRQVAIWFQNRRARTKQQQTKEDCENLKRGCAALTQENRRLQGEVAELRALLTNPASFTATNQLLRSVRHCPIS
ncbi:homeobox-leucine zipper protein HOX7-like [Miscanthus floridulus]|uniref:homeobox-leucine zipper protein HOX7-like n=1 Tax=Miscanthus floridulus TaxID=154761 RepID=UPI00345824DF